MSEKIPVIAIFDIGKTNKKLLLFNEQYKLVQEQTTQFDETVDEDGFPAEDIVRVTGWVKESFNKLLSNDEFEIRAVNFSAYGASFMYLDENSAPMLPLYNYLKPYKTATQNKFYTDYGGERLVAMQTSSPVLGNLNSGMQLYRLKYEKPALFNKIKYALHLPQYFSFVLSGALFSDITSIGCHTNLWNFQKQQYHNWVEKEGIFNKLPPIKTCDAVAGFANKNISVGIGLHDSSAALVPYLFSFSEPFILLSTGTWCISLNPFNHSAITDEELQQDCLCYLSHEGKPVKASRLFAGNEHEVQIKKLSVHYNKPIDYYRKIVFDAAMLKRLENNPFNVQQKNKDNDIRQSNFQYRDLKTFSSYEEAYHQLMIDIIQQQIKSTNLVLHGTQVKRIFVDGGFSKNAIYMHLLAAAFPQMEVYAASVAQASAVGAALVFHKYWNNKPLPSDIINLKLYSVMHSSTMQ